MQINTNINTNKIIKIQQTEKINNKQKKCPICGYPVEDNKFICEYCKWDDKC